MKKKVAVLLAAYNGTEWIKEQIESIRCQINVSVYVYISVDISTDETYAYCLSLSHNYHNVCVLPYGEKFGSAGKNFYRLVRDCDISDFDYVAFSDQDDIWNADKLSKAIEMLRDFDCYSSNVMAFWVNGKETLIDKAQSQLEWDFLFEAAGPGCTYVFRRDFALAFKAWLLLNYEEISCKVALHDWLAYAFARCNSYCWFIDVNPSMRYRQHANNQVGTNNNWRAAKKRLRLIRTHWYRDQVVNIARLLRLNNTPLVKCGLCGRYLGNLYLLQNIKKLRRRRRDRFALVIALLFNLF